MLLDELAGGLDDVLRSQRAGAHVVEHDHVEAAGERRTVRPNILGRRPAAEQRLVVALDRDFDSGERVDLDGLAVFDHLKVLARQPADQAARALGDALAVAINGDDSVRALKGEGRPLNPESDRAEVVAALECVDYVVIFPEVRVTSLLERVRPADLRQRRRLHSGDVASGRTGGAGKNRRGDSHPAVRGGLFDFEPDRKNEKTSTPDEPPRDRNPWIGERKQLPRDP